MIQITSLQDGFWRCGVPHSKAPTTYPDDRFTDDELVRLKEEPMLLVEVIPEDKTESEEQIEDELLAAARQAVTDGKTIGSGAPDLKALELILGRSVTAADRDQAWEVIQAEEAGE